MTEHEMHLIWAVRDMNPEDVESASLAIEHLAAQKKRESDEVLHGGGFEKSVDLLCITERLEQLAEALKNAKGVDGHDSL